MELADYSPITKKHFGLGMTVAGLCAAAIMYNGADKDPGINRIWEFLDEYEKSL